MKKLIVFDLDGKDPMVELVVVISERPLPVAELDDLPASIAATSRSSSAAS